MGGKLRAKAFVVTQEELLNTVDRYYPEERIGLSEQEVALYQVRVSELEALTGLDFGGLATCDTDVVHESSSQERGLPILDERDLLL